MLRNRPYHNPPRSNQCLRTKCKSWQRRERPSCKWRSPWRPDIPRRGGWERPHRHRRRSIHRKWTRGSMTRRRVRPCSSGRIRWWRGTRRTDSGFRRSRDIVGTWTHRRRRWMRRIRSCRIPPRRSQCLGTRCSAQRRRWSVRPRSGRNRTKWRRRTLGLGPIEVMIREQGGRGGAPTRAARSMERRRCAFLVLGLDDRTATVTRKRRSCLVSREQLCPESHLPVE
mmetsp:Transcript_9193/g.20588  ORF Transcript_9193/g.20588 Transcript_9193/m.20588 type:complete len:226 (+) Transcript_9193:281-958(+)